MFEDRTNSNRDDDGASNDEDVNSDQRNEARTFDSVPHKGRILYKTKKLPYQR